MQVVQGLLKRRADGGCASEVLEVLDSVRREHGPEGVGLTYVYQLAMEACALESRWRDALVLFDEVGWSDAGRLVGLRYYVPRT